MYGNGRAGSKTRAGGSRVPSGIGDYRLKGCDLAGVARYREYRLQLKCSAGGILEVRAEIGTAVGLDRRRDFVAVDVEEGERQRPRAARIVETGEIHFDKTGRSHTLRGGHPPNRRQDGDRLLYGVAPQRCRDSQSSGGGAGLKRNAVRAAENSL